METPDFANLSLCILGLIVSSVEELSYKRKALRILLTAGLFITPLTGVYDYFMGKRILLPLKLFLSLFFLLSLSIEKKDYEKAVKLAFATLIAIYTFTIPLMIDDKAIGLWIVILVLVTAFFMGIKYGLFSAVYSALLCLTPCITGGSSSLETFVFSGHILAGGLTALFMVMVYENTMGEYRMFLKRRAELDFLTGLYLRWKLYNFLELEIERAKRFGRPFSLVMIDLDNFKKLNDTRGHLEGDKVLKGVADLIKRNSRKMDFSARFGGDEFVIVLPETSIDGALRFAEKIKGLIEKGFYPITASVGVTAYRPGDVVEKILMRADKALYMAKRKGRNRIEAL